ncbi:MAG TPA: hypothetical protein DCE80_06705 [Ignavibacteriales bacterium]|nr:hypothetical protein [Ignavibacteriales bacterium]
MPIDVSVIVPTSDRKIMLERCLGSLLDQTYPKEKMEIIIVDDRADGKIAIISDNLRSRYPNIRYFAQYNKGPAIARNLGIGSSVGEIIAFVDDDCVVDKTWIERIVEGHQGNPDIIAIGGDTIVYASKIPILVSQFLSTCSIETFIDNKKEVIFFPTCNVSFKREIFLKYKFNEQFPFPGGEDLELFWCLYKDGYRFIWDKKMKAIHYRDKSLFSFLKQAYMYGRGNLLAQHIHKDHPLLKELKADKSLFWLSMVINIVKIPRFSYILGNRLLKDMQEKGISVILSVYAHFVLHKVFYIAGNIREFFRIRNGIYVKSYVQS